MDSLQGKYLLDNLGNPITAETVLEGKTYVVYYFSASYSKPCETLLPMLKEIHAAASERNISLEIIYISSDTEEEQMLEYFKENHGNWFAIPFGDTAANELRYRFGVTSIPYIVVIKNNKTIVTRNGKAEIEKLGINVLVTWIG